MKHAENFEMLVHLAKIRTGIDVRYTRSRRDEIVLIKGCIINVLSKYFGLNTVQIGGLFDLHHSTIIHHLKAHPTRYRYEDDYATHYDYLLKASMNKDKDTIDVESVLATLKSALSV